MGRTTPPRPVDIAALFPEIRPYARTATRLHPRPGAPTAGTSSVGGPLLWPAAEPWPVCREPHPRSYGIRPADARRRREILAAAWLRPRPAAGGLTYAGDEEAELDAMTEGPHPPPLPDDAPVPLMALAQLFVRDVPALAEFAPGDTDLLQVLWCPFDEHRSIPCAPALRLVWRRAAQVTEVLAGRQPEPEVVEDEGYVPEPCVLHPEQVTDYPWHEYLPDALAARIRIWEEGPAQELPGAPSYRTDLSLAPGWKAGGWESWSVTDLQRQYCDCGRELRLMLTIDSSEWGGASWWPREDPSPTDPDLPPVPLVGEPTEIAVGRYGAYRVFVCPADASHPHGADVQ
ncbi:hypothetical protein [Streptomyces sp. NPDC001787]|uniref:hypothetical protein n=1 Tax=Streptomyces sp. NPDC001787 TaxID=3154523 RepID=UPI00331C86B0